MLSPDAVDPEDAYSASGTNVPTPLPYLRGDVASTEPSALPVSTSFHNEHNHPLNRQEVERMVHDIGQHFATLIAGNRQQNEVIIAHAETIARQSEELAQQRITIANLQIRFDGMCQEFARLYSLYPALNRCHTRESQDILEAQMENNSTVLDAEMDDLHVTNEGTANGR